MENLQIEPRRSKRLNMTSSDNCCWLDVIPEEIFHILMKYLSLRDIGTIALTSHQFRVKVVLWFNSASGLKKVGHKCFQDITSETEFNHYMQICKSFGIFVKRLTMLFGTQNRIKVLEGWFERFRCMVLGPELKTDEWFTLLYVSGFSAVFSHFSLGWDEGEFGAIISVFNKAFGFRDKIQAFLGSKNLHQELESDLKIVLRSFYWDHGIMTGSFLAHLFQSFFPMEDKDIAKLIYLMVGPSCMNHVLQRIDYQSMSDFQRVHMYKRLYHPHWNICEEEIPSSYNEAKDMMEDLGQVLANLFLASKMSESRIFNIIDILIGVRKKESGSLQKPTWLMDNVATLLLFSSGNLIKAYLMHCKNIACYLRVADLIVSMIVVCDRMDNELAPEHKPGVNSILDWIFTKFPRYLKPYLYADFWHGIMDRIDESELSGGMLIQLGTYISSVAYQNVPSPFINAERNSNNED